MLHRQADARALQDADQRRTHRGQQAQQRDAPELQPPVTRARPQQQEEGKQSDGAGQGEPDPVALAQHPEQHDLQSAEDAEVPDGSGQPGGGPGQ
ncbi:MAG: hypothetical protein E6J07_00910 [Chloroflexi bacterium]|nr:MAG: hypothetical protein E6J07_00910 [Chloroflexota bacterium]